MNSGLNMKLMALRTITDVKTYQQCDAVCVENPVVPEHKAQPQQDVTSLVADNKILREKKNYSWYCQQRHPPCHHYSKCFVYYTTNGYLTFICSWLILYMYWKHTPGKKKKRKTIHKVVLRSVSVQVQFTGLDNEYHTPWSLHGVIWHTSWLGAWKWCFLMFHVVPVPFQVPRR